MKVNTTQTHRYNRNAWMFGTNTLENNVALFFKVEHSSAL